MIVAILAVLLIVIGALLGRVSIQTALIYLLIVVLAWMALTLILRNL